MDVGVLRLRTHTHTFLSLAATERVSLKDRYSSPVEFLYRALMAPLDSGGLRPGLAYRPETPPTDAVRRGDELTDELSPPFARKPGNLLPVVNAMFLREYPTYSRKLERLITCTPWFNAAFFIIDAFSCIF